MRSRQAIQESGRNNREVGTTGAPWLLLIKSGEVVMRAVDAADHPPTFTHMPMVARLRRCMRIRDAAWQCELYATRHGEIAESGVGRGPDRGVGVEARIGRYGAASSERPSPARISASYAPNSASTIDSTASKGARSAPSRWCRSAINPGEL